MKRLTTHSIALIIALTILAVALSLVSLARWFNSNTSKPLTVRNIQTISLPPPPPPPKPVEQQQIDMPTIDISASGNGPQIEMALVKPEIEFTQPPIDISLNVNTTNWQEALEVDWQAFGLNELDNMPVR